MPRVLPRPPSLRLLVKGTPTFRRVSSSSKAHGNYYDKYAGGQGTRQEGLKVHRNIKLSDIFEVEKARGLEATTIGSIWATYFDKIPFTFGLSVPDTVYARWIGERARQSPICLIPLGVGSGICNVMAQHQVGPQGRAAVAFTPLDEYQKYREGAPVRMLSFLFDDYIRDKQLCLIRTQFDGSIFTRDQAMRALKDCIDLYSADDSYQFVQQFNHVPQTFDYATFSNFYQVRFSPKSQ